MRGTNGWEKTVGRQAQFLRIRWEVINEDTDEVVALEATLCLAHRLQIALNGSARATGQFGESCDYCDGRQPGMGEKATSLE